MRGVGWEVHVTSRDPTLDAVGTRNPSLTAPTVKPAALQIDATHPGPQVNPMFYGLTSNKAPGQNPRSPLGWGGAGASPRCWLVKPKFRI